MIKGLLIATALSGIAASAADAQTITGKVVDSRTGETLIGATVYTSDKSKGVVTNYDGEFKIDVKSLPVKLNISYTGYKNQNLTVYDDEDEVNIQLTENRSFLNDVVVVGYGTQKRTQLTGAVATINTDIIENAVSPSFENLLSGAIPGVNVTTNSQPGAQSSVRIRGGNSVNAKNDPLYVIDGFIYYKDGGSLDTGAKGTSVEGGVSPLSLLNPSDIESIEVLKDVSATAIYGSRGANGVIIVNTKKGERGKPQVKYDYSITVANSAKKIDILNAQEFARFQNTYFPSKRSFTEAEIAALGEGTDWQSAVLQTGITHNHNLSISGGDDKTRYLIGGNITSQDGVVLNTGFSRSSLRFNLDREVFKNLSVGVNAVVSRSRQKGLTSTASAGGNNNPFQDGITSSFVYALLMPPTVSVYNEDGSYNYNNPYEYGYFKSGSTAANPVSDLKNSTAETVSDDVLGNAYLKYTILPDFVAKASFGFDLDNYTQNFYAPSYTALGLEDDGIGSIVKRRLSTWQHEYTLDYSKQINDANFINALIGYTYQSTDRTHSIASSSDYSNETLGVNNLQGGQIALYPQSGRTESNLHSVIARVNYTLLDRYNATATFRADRSSRFANGHNWGYFPSIGLSWNLDKESFLKKASDKWLDGLKIRASVGTVGNQEIGDYLASTTYNTTTISGTTVYTKTNDANKNLKWETTTSYNAGFDLSILNGKWSFVADAYYKKTNDLLLRVPSDLMTTGVSTQVRNVGNVANKGFELAVTYNPIHKRKHSLSLTANVAYNKNEVSSLGNNAKLYPEESYYILKVGESVGSYYGYIFDGVVQATDDVSKLPTSVGYAPKVGSAKFRDVNNDGKIDTNDRTVIGKSQPDFTFGLNASYSYRNFDAFVLFQGQTGGSVYNQLARRLDLAGDSYNVSTRLLDSWTSANASNEIVSVNNVQSMMAYIDSRYVESTDYFRLKTISLGYTFNVRPIKAKVRVSATASNLLTITGYSGFDPEVTGGIDTGAYPSARSFTFGINITL